MKRLLIASICFLSFQAVSEASTMTYKFLIPAFGGDPNYFYVFKTEADVQNIYHAPEKPEPQNKTSDIEDFKNRLKYAILSRLADRIVEAAFGETSLPQGTYEIEGIQVNVQAVGNEIQVHLIDTTTGNETTVEVPMYK